MDNPLYLKMKILKVKFNKKLYPKFTANEMRNLGITPEEISKYCQQATVYHTLGPHWCYGFFICNRPMKFKEHW